VREEGYRGGGEAEAARCAEESALNENATRRWRSRIRVASTLFAVDAEIVVEHSHSAISIDGNVQIFVHQKVISWALADYPEIIYEGCIRLPILQRRREALAGNPSCLVLGTSGLADSTDTLRLRVQFATDLVAIDSD
jgi:hypothetical protein